MQAKALLRGGLAVALLLGILVLWRSTMSAHGEYVPSGRDIAAAFLGADPNKLEFVGTLSHPPSRGVQRLDERWSAALDREVEVRVDPEERYVTSAAWDEAVPSQGQPKVPREAAGEVALEWARKFPGFEEEGERSYLFKDMGDNSCLHQFDWRGEGPGNCTHSIRVQVDAVTGHPLWYGASIFPPPPDATMPVKITPQQARELALKQVQQIAGLKVETLRVSEVRTNTLFRPPGEPVYSISIDGSIDVGDGHAYGYSTDWGVHATSGEVLTEEYHPSAKATQTQEP